MKLSTAIFSGISQQSEEPFYVFVFSIPQGSDPVDEETKFIEKYVVAKNYIQAVMLFQKTYPDLDASDISKIGPVIMWDVEQEEEED